MFKFDCIPREGSRSMFDIVDKDYLKGVPAPPVLALAARVGPLTSWARNSDSEIRPTSLTSFPGGQSRWSLRCASAVQLSLSAPSPPLDMGFIAHFRVRSDDRLVGRPCVSLFSCPDDVAARHSGLKAAAKRAVPWPGQV